MPWLEAPARCAPEPGGVAVLLADLDEAPYEFLLGLLSGEERARAERFVFERHRRRFVAGRALLRVVLGELLGRDPRALRFAAGAHGKPALDEASPWRFNLAHSSRLALLALAAEREVGVDIERVRELSDAEDIAVRFFSPNESEALRQVAAGERQAAFFRCWSRKEAFIKATGEGLSRPLDSFDVSLDGGAPRLLRAEGEGRTFWLGEPAAIPGFAAAVAVEGGAADIASWRFARWEGGQA